jgi:hypothetical protein
MAPGGRITAVGGMADHPHIREPYGPAVARPVTVFLLVIVLLSPEGLYKTVASVVKSCPSQQVVFDQLDRDVLAGVISGYWATCAPIKITPHRRGI